MVGSFQDMDMTKQPNLAASSFLLTPRQIRKRSPFATNVLARKAMLMGGLIDRARFRLVINAQCGRGDRDHRGNIAGSE